MPHPLYIEKLVEIFPAFEPSFLLMLTYAGAVCFNERGHRYGVTLRVSGDYEKEYAVFWPAITDRIRRTWVDIDYATEHGAYGVAFMLINDLTGYAILEQSYRGTVLTIGSVRIATCHSSERHGLRYPGFVQAVNVKSLHTCNRNSNRRRRQMESCRHISW